MQFTKVVNMRMKRVHIVIILFISLSLISLSCSTVPITGRSQLNLISDSEMLAMSFQQYDVFLKESELSTNKIISNGGNIIFYIDFHSTQEDVFYTQTLESTIPKHFDEEMELTARENHTLMNNWLKNLQSRLPEYYVNIIDTLSKSSSPTSDRWIQKTFNTPAVTYETGDETNRELIKKVAEGAAEELIRLLLKETSD